MEDQASRRSATVLAGSHLTAAIPANGNLILVWANAVAKIGVPSAIAVFMVWVLTQELPRIVKHLETLTVELRGQNELIRKQLEQGEEALRLARWTCAGVQRNDADRKACFDK